MPTITSYLYENKITVQVLDDDPTLKTRNRIVYSRPVKIYQGVDNVITLNFKNDDQKAANIIGKTFTFSVNASVGNVAVWTTTANISNLTTATGTVTIYSANVANLTQELYNYTVTYASGALRLPTYVDDNFGASGQLEIIPNVF